MSRITTFSIVGLIVGFLGIIYSYTVYGNAIVDEIFGKYDEVDYEETYNADEINEIHIDLSGANLLVKSHDADDIKVIFDSKIYEISGNSYDLTTNQNGDDLYITLNQNRTIKFASLFNEVEVTLLLPSQSFDEVNILSNVSRVEIHDIVLDVLNIEANVATVSLNDVHANDINLEVTVGNVDMDEVNSHLDIELNLAKMVVSITEITQNISLKADGGKIDFIFKEEPTHLNVDFMVDEGSIDIDLPLSYSEKSRKTVKGTVGNGEHLLYGRFGGGIIKMYVE